MTALKTGLRKQPKVYVVQEPLYKDKRGTLKQKFSLAPAEAFGELSYILNWSDPAELNIKQIIWKIRKALRDMTREDYILMLGNPTAMSMAAVVASEMTDGCFQILYWDNVKEEYKVIEVDMHAQPL